MTRQQMWVSSVTIGAPNPRDLAVFYQRLLGWTISAMEDPRPGEPPEAGWAQLCAPADLPGLRTINIEYERYYTRPVWPSEPGRQHITVHLDLPVEDLDAAQARALEAGATLADTQPQDAVRVILDPAGHPVCLFSSA
ncbi:VOC family protein [Nocardia wallacei]|uniref:VOC family protein n=1 Tax=Nocardia wallacei TaxID=480035 RepID=UPI00313CF923